MQIIKNKAFRVSVQWNALVRKPLALERGGFTIKIKEPAPTSFLITCSYGVRGSLGVVGELFQNASYLFI
ncbi:hypothetical protein JP0009_02180 [Helicobacter pylori]